jgi:arginine:pyruvate transaminase
LKLSTTVERLQGLGSDKWAVHIEGRRRQAAGEDMIFLSIGEPDLLPPQSIKDVAYKAMLDGRTRYSGGRGEPNVLRALSQHYTKQTGREITPLQFLFLPGTQASLYFAFMSILEVGDEVLAFDPYYATYDSVIRAPGGVPVPVPLDPDKAFHPDLNKLEKAITPKTRAILLNSPSNPTGAVFTAEEIAGIGAIAKKHDLWIVSDEVYATLIFEPHQFVSPFFDQSLEDRVIVVSSISKSHALPGFRCGWLASSQAYVDKALALSEAMLFGSQPFLSDAVEHALNNEFAELAAMRRAYHARGTALLEGLRASNRVKTRMPEGGMFLMVDIRDTGVSGDHFARRLMQEEKVVTMPGESFGSKGAGHLRVALTVDEAQMAEAAQRIISLANRI